MNIQPLWYICLSVRVFIIYLVWIIFSKHIKYIKNYQSNIQNITMVILFMMGCGFLFKSYYGSNNEKQLAKVFWHDTRLIHGVLYILSVLYLTSGKVKIACILLGLDVIFSLIYRITM